MIALFFDTETTGFPSEKNPVDIVQIAAILQDTEGDRRVLGELNALVETEQVMPQHLVDNVHGISNDLLRRFGMPPDVAAEPFFAMLQVCDRLVGHNIAFDIGVIKQYKPWAIMMNIIENREQFCTMRELTPVLKLPKTGKSNFHNDFDPNYKAPSLAEAHQYFIGRPIDNAHDAMSDTRALRDIYFAHVDHIQEDVL